MSKGAVGGVVLAAALIFGGISAVTCMERIPTGYVGVVYSMNGGVQDEILTQGFHVVAPTKKVKKFTVGNEQLVLTKDSRDGSKDDDSFNVATADSLCLRAVSLYYDLPEQLPDVLPFQAGRGS